MKDSEDLLKSFDIEQPLMEERGITTNVDLNKKRLKRSEEDWGFHSHQSLNHSEET